MEWLVGLLERIKQSPGANVRFTYEGVDYHVRRDALIVVEAEGHTIILGVNL